MTTAPNVSTIETTTTTATGTAAVAIMTTKFFTTATRTITYTPIGGTKKNRTVTCLGNNSLSESKRILYKSLICTTSMQI